MPLDKNVRIIGVGLTSLNAPIEASPSSLMQQALFEALRSVGLKYTHLNGLIAVPSLAEPHFMEAHYLSTRIGLLPKKNFIARTIDTGGAGPVTGLLEARRMIQQEGLDLVAVVAGDAVKALSAEEFLKRADKTCSDPQHSDLKSPVIPNGYDRIAQYQMQTFGLTRRQLAACSALMSIMASRHPFALTRKPRTIEQVLESAPIGKVTNLLECARRADGAGALLVASSSFLSANGLPSDLGCVVSGGGEASGPLYPAALHEIDETMFSCEEAANTAYLEAQLSASDIDFFGLYDCFSICLIRAIEAVGLADKGKGGQYVENAYYRIVRGMEEAPGTFQPQSVFPINTHGGLLAFGAPWETPAIYNIIEAFHQLMGKAGIRQVKYARRALVYGNGGIFSSSAVTILSKVKNGSRL